MLKLRPDSTKTALKLHPESTQTAFKRHPESAQAAFKEHPNCVQTAFKLVSKLRPESVFSPESKQSSQSSFSYMRKTGMLTNCSVLCSIVLIPTTCLIHVLFSVSCHCSCLTLPLPVPRWTGDNTDLPSNSNILKAFYWYAG